MRKSCFWVVPFFVVLLPILASAASKSGMVKIKVLDSETRSLPVSDNGTPLDCDGVNFDAYCRSSRAAQMRNTLLVQEDGQAPFRVACTMESRYSKCSSLPIGEIFDAVRDKHGLTVYYADDNGKVKRQLYTLVADGKIPSAPAASAGSSAANSPSAEAQPAQPSAVPGQNVPTPTVIAQPAEVVAPTPVVPKAVAPTPPQNIAPGPLPSASRSDAERAGEKVRCKFGSTPAGAEITLDGRYVGNTPSEIGVKTGTHVVEFSLSGFARWKRELTVLPDSELSISAVMQAQ